MAGDIRSSFDLNDRPATAAMRRLRREGELTDVVYERLGKTIDETFTEKNVAEIDNYERKLKSVSRQATTSLTGVRREWGKTERDVLRSISVQEAAIGSLDDRMERLSHKRITPKIDMKGITEALAQTELLEARLNALSRETVRPRVSVSGTTSGMVHGGGGSSFGGSSMKLPFAGSVPLPLVGAALGAAPPLLGAATATVGSLGGAALGAGAIGIAAGGVGAAALGETAPVIVGAVKGIKEASKALAKYQEQVIKSGPNSEAARQAYRKLNMELNATPGARQFLHARTQLSSEFKEATMPARRDVTAIGTRGLNLGRQLTPQFSRLSNRFFDEARPQADQFANFLQDDQSRAFFESMGKESTAALAPTEHIAENVTATLMNLSRAARPFFHEGLEFLDKWTGGWRKSSKDIGSVRGEMSQWVTDLKAWGHLTSATFRLLRDLAAPGQKSGNSLVNDLSHQLDTWDSWIKRNPRQVRAFFRESVDSTEKLATALSKITKFLWEIGQMLSPLLGELSQFITFASNSGLLTSGMLPLLLAGGAGVRNLMGGARGRILGTSGGAAGGLGAAEGLAAGSLLGGGGAGGLLARRGAMFGPVSGLGKTYGLARSFGYSRTAAAAAEVGAVPGGGAFARGFGARFLPIAAVLGGLQFASTPGSLNDRSQAAASSLTLGLIPPPKTQAQTAEDAVARARDISMHYQRKYGTGLRGFNRQLAGLRRSRSHLLTPSGESGGLDIGFSGASSFSDFAQHGLDFHTHGKGVSDEDRQAAEALRKEMQDLRAKRASFAMERGGELGGQIRGAFNIRKAHGAVSAMADVKDEVLRQLDAQHLGKAGGRVLAQNVLNWAKEAKRDNPKLTAAYEEMVNRIEGRFARMGKNIEIINGQIYTGSKKEWGAIAAAMANPIEQAKEEVTAAFTTIQRQAINSLKAMGFSPGQAKQLVNEAEKGGETGRTAKANMRAGPVLGGTAFTTPGEKASSGHHRGDHARGGRLPYPAGGGDRDEVALGNNQWGAGGEVVVPSHVERRINRMLGNANTGTTLGREVAMNNRAHWQMAGGDYGLGGRMRRFASGGITAAATLAERMGMGVSGGPGHGGIPSSGHATDSLHYSGLAYDVTGSSSQMRRYFLNAWRQFHGSINELFYDPMGYYYDEGHKAQGEIGGHSDHVHIGFFPGGAHLARGAGRTGRMGGRGGGAAGHVDLKGRHSHLGGIPGVMANRANDMVAAGYSQRLNAMIGGGGAARGPGRFGSATGTLSFGQIRALASRAGMANPTLMAHIAESESGGRTGVVNSIGATGLWQIYNHPDLVAKYGPMTNAWNNARAAGDLLKSQGLGAWAASQGSWGQYAATGGRMRRGFAGWFANGFRGRVSGPTMFGAGEAGEEDVSITPTTRSGRAGRRGGGGGAMPIVHVNMGGVTIANGQDAKTIGEQVGRHAARKIKEALENSDSVSEEELTSA